MHAALHPTADAGKNGLDLLEHACDVVEIYHGLEEARRLVKWLRQKEMLLQMIAILQQGLK